MTEGLRIRPEGPGDVDAIARVTKAAFLTAAHASHTEQYIVAALRRSGQLTVSLVAEQDGRVVAGHVAMSPVEISDGTRDWYGLGPVSVQPERQSQRIGSRLIDAALHDLRSRGAAGCVVVGDPGYYARFGFRVEPGLVYPGLPAEYFQALCFTGPVPQGVVCYSAAFEAVA